MLNVMTETPLWQRNLASLIRSGLFVHAGIVDARGLHAVVGIYPDGSKSAALAKYADLRRAEHALSVVEDLAAVAVPVGAN